MCETSCQQFDSPPGIFCNNRPSTILGKKDVGVTKYSARKIAVYRSNFYELFFCLFARKISFPAVLICCELNCAGEMNSLAASEKNN